MLYVHHSNRLEALLDGLIRVTGTDMPGAPASDPFALEVVVVQQPGMGRWITQQLARRTGIAARLAFPSPSTFFWQILRAWRADLPEQSAFDREILLWRIMALLPGLIAQPAFAALRRYLARDDSDLRLFQLARRIADLFDRYRVFRPDQVLTWEAGSEDHWQAQLWRALAEGAAGQHPTRLLRELVTTQRLPLAGALPRRVSLFGLHALAPLHLEVLGVLARHTQIHLFYLNPSRRYRDGQQASQDNPLLVALGHTDRAFLDLLLGLGGEQQDAFVAHGDATLLRCLQGDILESRDRRHADPRARTSLGAADASVQIHACHSPLREIQVLHDRLLRLFETLPGLEPRDVLVMAPDMRLYAPYVEAVLGAAEGARHIPWAIADHHGSAVQPLITALRGLLELPGSRFEASEILSLLQVPAIQRRLGLDETGLERIHAWVRETGIRWGADAAQRAALGLPAEPGHTWAFGLQRLFLGYALTPDPQAGPYAGVLPYPDVEGSEVQYLGALQSFLDRLVHWRQRLQEPRPLDDWRATLNALLADLFLPDSEEQALFQSLREGLDRIATQATGVASIGPLSLELFRTLLGGLLEETGGVHRLLTGRVTFCALESLRGVPFRVVCLLGMNGSAFPRHSRPLSFDLMAQTPRPGDPSRRRDDCDLFLEALLAARDGLYISYLGNDPRDNSVKTPSVLVSALLDYAGQAYRFADGGDLVSRLWLRHPLQPFSRRYFDASDPRLWSFASDWLEAARSEALPELPRFVAAPLEAPEEALRTLDLDDLVRCLVNPAQYFLTRRLGLVLNGDADIPEDLEPFTLDALEGYHLRQSLLLLVRADRNEAELLVRLRATGLLPHGAIGEIILREALERTRAFVPRLEQCAAPPLEPLDLDLTLGRFHLRGRLEGLRADGLFGYRFGRLRCRDRLGLWVRHLALGVLRPPGVALTSRYLAEDTELRLAPVEEAAKLLGDLLELRWQALMAPLPFFPESGLAWREQGPYSSAFHKAWDDVNAPYPESRDAAVQMAFRGVDPIGERFIEMLTRILGPLADHSILIGVE